MGNRRLVVALGVLSGAMACIAAAACTPGNGNPIFNTPTPAPVASPTPVARCQLVWSAVNAANPAAVDAWVVDGPQSTWTNGPQSYDPTGVGFTGAFLSGYSMPATNIVDITQAAALATAGNFSLGITVGGTAPGEAITFTASTGALLAAAAGTAGKGSFTGTISGGAPVTLFTTQTVTAKMGGTVETLGNDGSYAICFQPK